MDFDAFQRDILENGWRVFGAEVYENGRLTHAFGDTNQTRHPIYSVTKSVTSLAVGIARDEGKIGLEANILRCLPGRTAEKMTGAQRDRYRTITLRRLLTMSVSGYPFRPEGENWLDFSLAVPLADPETPRFEYSNIPAYLVSAAAACAVGEDLKEYLNRKLFRPLGIQDPPCQYSPEGYFYGATGIELTVHELSRLGLLILNGGVYEGKRIVSEEYVREMTAVQQMTREGGYGYFLWKYRDGCSMNGKWGQKCYVLPGENRVIAFLAHMEDGSDPVRESMERHLLDKKA